MSTDPIVHGSFTIQRTYQAPVARVFAAWSDIDLKARWFIGPPDRWTVVKRQLDFRVGGTELLHGRFVDRHDTIFRARYHAIVPNQRLVYVYDMWTGDLHLSVSLASVEFAALAGGGTRMTFTEQAAFLDGKDGTKSREAGTDSHFTRLTEVLDDPREIVSTRVFAHPRDVVFGAFSDPDQLARWWGPKEVTNSFQHFDFRSGGSWRFVMHGPGGTDYQMDKEFVEIVPLERIVIQHHQATHRFRMTISLIDLGDQTYLTWRMRFDLEDEARRVRDLITRANEENFDRLAGHLAAGRVEVGK